MSRRKFTQRQKEVLMSYGEDMYRTFILDDFELKYCACVCCAEKRDLADKIEEALKKVGS